MLIIIISMIMIMIMMMVMITRWWLLSSHHECPFCRCEMIKTIQPNGNNGCKGQMCHFHPFPAKIHQKGCQCHLTPTLCVVENIHQSNPSCRSSSSSSSSSSPLTSSSAPDVSQKIGHQSSPSSNGRGWRGKEDPRRPNRLPSRLCTYKFL